MNNRLAAKGSSFRSVALKTRFFWALLVLTLSCFAGAVKAESPGGGNIYACNQDSDCVIKDVRNCCGYYPACVNAGAVIDVESVDRECAKQSVMGVCGFPEISGCACQNGSCVSVESESSPEDKPE